MSTITAYLGLGTNLGDRPKQLQQAVQLLAESDGITISKVSAIYQTEPVGYVDQPDFLNIAVRLETNLTATELLTTALEIEQKLQRVRTIRWGPRTMDIDILLYGKEYYQSSHLEIPHPRMWERAFVLVPLLDVMEPFEREFWRVSEYLAKLPDRKEVHKTPLSLALQVAGRKTLQMEVLLNGEEEI
ncbi:2-amino-4-hydroxy-6-hydroxymethyldihydropteridine diphosphokinase [Risungbinella massiliensis]|uniref:2-amino-4-hydroxy-6- hydroxymethyldihydropteridine diphosphokinase n=1 Tax=Risungbinella massiliensis TaxID=1329796 RepID=UPI0009E41575|nr:2-amino-4-hydroxy-6-hydroxymethyldihydropteridine diphosphokinase [Risungbinella massiliensis]